jgi:hypothetical protein
MKKIQRQFYLFKKVLELAQNDYKIEIQYRCLSVNAKCNNVPTKQLTIMQE